MDVRELIAKLQKMDSAVSVRVQTEPDRALLVTDAKQVIQGGMAMAVVLSLKK